MKNGQKWTLKEVACTKSSFYHQAEREQIKGPRTQKKASLSLGLATPKAETQTSSESLATTGTHNPLVGLKK